MTGRLHAPTLPATSGPREAGVADDARRVVDRFGREHVELAPTPSHPSRSRERDWERVDTPAFLTPVSAGRNPRITPDPDPNFSLWTWVVRDTTARVVLLWTNPVFDHENPSRMEMDRDGDLWSITLRLPSAMRFTYRISIWREDSEPPWRTVSGRRPVLLAAAGGSTVDPAGPAVISSRAGEMSSVCAGPTAPRQEWRKEGEGDVVKLGDASIYTPPSRIGPPTPLLVLYDGQNWLRLGLPGILDELIGSGRMLPVHVAMVDSRDNDYRREHLGVPGGQVDMVIDVLLPAVRDRFSVDPSGEKTVVAGQSFGGIAALWTLALGGGEVRHAIAQSPSLWRFDVADALLDADWTSVEMHAGAYEGDMLLRVRELSGALNDDPRLGDRTVHATGFEAGHDWAAWRVNLVNSLRDTLARI